MLHGSISHVSITVSDVPEAMRFFRPFLEFLGYIVPPGDEGQVIVSPPAEWPFTPVGKYYAVYFRGPDGMKFEYVHMDSLEELHRKAGLLGKKLWTHEGS